MNTLKTFKHIGLGILIGSMFISCGGEGTEVNNNNSTDSTNVQISTSKKAGDPNLVIHELSDPDRLNPISSTGAAARYIQYNVFSRLLEFDPENLSLEPQLASKRPEIKEVEEGPYKGGMSVTYEIRPEAVWDNGEPVTASDYVFTIKALKNPKVNGGTLRPYFDFVHNIEIDPTNPKKFTIFSKSRYFLAEEASGEYICVLPEYIYDPEGIMRKFSLKDMSDAKSLERLSNDPNIARFAENFNSSKHDREAGSVVGSGPYKFVEWETGQRIVLEKKADWWGDKVDAKMLNAFPAKIVYKIITDLTTAVVNMKDEEIDVMRSIKPADFIDLKDNPDFNKKYELSTPDQFAYYYIGFNTKKPKFTDKNVRRAFAHLIDRDRIIETLYEGMAIKTNGPVNPNKPYYKKDMPDIEFNLEKAKELLAAAGWTDSDGDGLLDKTVDGKKEVMRVEYKYNQGNTIRKNIGLMLKDDAARIGVEINIVPREWTVFLEDTKKRDFELMCLAWVSGPGLNDMKQIWHTESDTPDGSNRVSFGNEASDKIIDQIRVTLDEAEREKLYHEIQQMVYDEQPYVFLFVPSERISIHNRFDNAETSALRPGYKSAFFKLRGPAADGE